MTDDSSASSDIAKTADKANQLWSDLVPVIAFVVSYNVLRLVDFEARFGLEILSKDNALFWATGLLVALTAWFIIMKLVRGEKVPLFMVFSSAIVGGFGLLGIILQERAFIYVKPTIQQVFLGGLVVFSVLIGRNIWKVMFRTVFDLPDHAWNTLALRWAGYFFAMALWNEFLWRYYVPGFEQPLLIGGIPIAPAGTYEFLGITFGEKNAESIWANWKIGNMVITLIFALANTPYTLKHMRDGDDKEEASPA